MALFESFGENLAGITLTILLADIAPSSVRGGAIGLQRIFMDMGGFIGPLALIIIYYGFGSRNAFLVGAIIEGLNLILLILAKEKLKVREVEKAKY